MLLTCCLIGHVLELCSVLGDPPPPVPFPAAADPSSMIVK